MKKAILITTGSILGTTTLIAGGVFLPSLYLNSSPSTVKVDSNTTFISNAAKSSVTVKEAIMGTNKVNKGNYVLYFGSEGIDSNFKFLYNVTSSENIEQAKEQQMKKHNRQLSGDYWNVVNYVSNNIKAKEELVRPEFIAYVNLLGDGVRTSRQRVADEATSCLRDVIDARENYSHLSSDAQQEIKDKYKFVKDIIISNSDGTIQKCLGNGVLEFYSNLKQKYNNFFESTNAKPNETVYEKVKWNILPTSIPLKTNPFDTYQTWDKQTKYYDNSAYTQDFRDLWDFIQNYPLFVEKKPKDINANNGFILGYKNGVLTEFYDDSFEAGTPEGGEGAPDAPTESTKSVKAKEENVVAPEPSSQNSFYEWVKKQYAIEKNN